MGKVLICSTYELGHQPLGCAIPAAALEGAGHDVHQVDLAVEEWPEAVVASIDALVVSVPMHTALRLGLNVIERAKKARPGLPVALFGLYATTGAAVGALSEGDFAASDDDLAGLLAFLAERLGEKTPRHSAPVRGDVLPQRDGLPPLERYARLLHGTDERLVGALEASTGCNHRCRHCPVPIVHNGRSHAVALDVLATDLERLFTAGARHIHFADPDFLNRPAQALRAAALVHDLSPELSFDATIKVSHIVRHEAILPKLVECGLSFVVSAFESTSDVVLERLKKGHTRSDEDQAIELFRRLGIEIRPSLLPFTPWTCRSDLIELFDFVAENDLIANIDPVQYAIRLLIPPGSLLLVDTDPVLDAALRDFDTGELGYAWAHTDPLLDELASALARRAEEASSANEDAESCYRALRTIVFSTLQTFDPGPPAPTSTGVEARLRPHLSESWFCCAEPTGEQFARLSLSPGVNGNRP